MSNNRNILPKYNTDHIQNEGLTDSLSGARTGASTPSYQYKQGTFWERFKTIIIGSCSAFVLIILIIVVAVVASADHSDDPFNPKDNDFKMSPQCLNEENAEFSHNFIGTDMWVEDIAANHDYYFVAEGCQNETKRLSIYDPTSKELVKAIEMSNNTAPKRWDSELIVNSNFAVLDMKFREDATGNDRYNLTAIYNISGAPSEWDDEGQTVSSDTQAVLVKNDSYIYVAKLTSWTKITVYLQQLEPKNITVNSDWIAFTKGQNWKMGFDQAHNEFLIASYLNTTNTLIIGVRSGETMREVALPRQKALTQTGSDKTGPIKSFIKFNETHQLLHLYPVPDAQSDHKNQLWLLDTNAQVLSEINIDDYNLGENTTFELSSYEFNEQKYWFIVPDTGAELEFPKKPVYVTKDFQKKYEFNIGDDKQTRAIFLVKNKFVVAQAKTYDHTEVWQMRDTYSYEVQKGIEKELQ